MIIGRHASPYAAGAVLLASALLLSAAAAPAQARDRIPPTQPVVTVDQIGSTYVMLGWQSQDNGPHVWYTVYRDGNPFIRGSSATSGIATFLEPQTRYSFTVKAGDFAGNSSPLSDAAVVTTAPVNPADRSPPTVPGNLRASLISSDGEIRITWDQSVDDFDPQVVIRYDIRINGVFDSAVIGQGRQVTYLTEPGTNTITVTAQDTAGNVSAPASVTVQF
jgi:chitinase